MGGRLPSSARRMVDDSEGKAIGSGDCHMTPVRESPVSGPIHRPQFIDPVLRGVFRFLHTLSDTQSALASEGSNIFMKTAGTAIVALNRGYDFGRQYPAYACVSHHRFFTNFSYTYSTISDTVCI